jgi:hypothetical protein
MQVEAADKRSSTMAFIWAGARTLRRNHLGRFMKLRSDTAWLEGTLFEMDNPGQPGSFFPLVIFHFSTFLQRPSGSNLPMASLQTKSHLPLSSPSQTLPPLQLQSLKLSLLKRRRPPKVHRRTPIAMHLLPCSKSHCLLANNS